MQNGRQLDSQKSYSKIAYLVIILLVGFGTLDLNLALKTTVSKVTKWIITRYAFVLCRTWQVHVLGSTKRCPVVDLSW